VFKSNPDTGREHTVFVLSNGDVLMAIPLDAKPHVLGSFDVLEALKNTYGSTRYGLINIL
jgi:hypothetical protein